MYRPADREQHKQPGSLSPEEWRRFAAGDDEMLTTLVARHGAALHRRVRRFARDGDDAEDLCQETWIVAYERRDQYRGGVFNAWLAAIASSLARAGARRRRRRNDAWLQQPDLQVALEPSHEMTPHALLVLSEDLTAVANAIASLPARRRRVVELRLGRGLSVAATARELGCASGTVKASLAQALDQIRAKLALPSSTD